MRFGAGVVLALVCAASIGCGNNTLFRQYQYEEDVFLSLDGSATVYVNGSLAALDALRGATFDALPNARFNRDAIRAFFTSPVTTVISVSSSRRGGRQFAHVRVDTGDIRRLSEAPPFSWSTYEFAAANGRDVYKQTIALPAARDVPGVNWTGGEFVAFRLHLPSTVLNHNAGEANHRRGNILVWEQTLADREHGKALVLEAQIETESILAHALSLFAATALAVVVVFGLVIFWIMRRGAKPAKT